MNIEKNSHHCSRCGAPLTHNQGEVYCEYCGQVYIHASQDNNEEIIQETIEDASSQNKETNEYPSRWLAQINVSTGVDYNREEPDPSIVAKDMKKLDDYITKFFIFIIIGSVLLMLIFEGLSNLRDKFKNQYGNNTNTTATETTVPTATKPAADEINRQATETAIYKPSFIEVIYRDQYGGVVYPAGSDEDLPVATAMVLEYADANHLIFSLFVYNQSGKDIDASSLQEHLEIDSLAVTSNQEDEFICSLQKDNWVEDLFLKNHTRRKGMINCSGSLDPDASSIIIDFDMPNWGSSHLEIPIQADNEDLQCNIEIELAPENYSISAELHSEQPQLVWVKKSDIAIDDDRGITLSVDGCTPTTSQQGTGEYFLTLAYPSAYDERGYDENFITCDYDEPFSSEINVMSAGLKTTSGKIFTSQAVINKSEGTIHFTNETANQESILQLLRHNQEILDELQFKINER